MTTAATSLLGLALPVTGELSGTWGDTVNNSITALLDSAVAGTTTLSADVDVTLTTTTLAANQAREAIILWTAAGTVTRYITAPAQSKIYAVLNKSSTQSIVLRGVGPTTGVTILAGKQAMVAWDGTDYVEISSGYVDGPATSTDNAVARFDGTDGKLLQNSVVIIADTTGNMTGVGTLSSGAITSSSLTATRVLFAGTSGLIQDDADLTFNGTILTSTGFAGPLNGTVGATTANTGAFTDLSFSGTGTFSGGTANGVTYLNGSKVLTSGTALTFDGSKLAVGQASVTAGSVVQVNGALLASGIVTTLDTTNLGVQIGGGGTVAASGASTVAGIYADVNGFGGASDLIIRPRSDGTPGALRVYTGSSGGAERIRIDSSGLEVKQSQLIGYSSYAGIGTNGLAVAGNVGIGTSSPTQKLEVNVNGGNSATAYALIAAGGSNKANQKFGVAFDDPAVMSIYGSYDGTGVRRNEIRYAAASHVFTSSGAASEYMRLDSSGNLLVGQTSQTAPGVGNTTTGFAVGGSTGYIAASRASGTVMFLNRNSDGDLLNFNSSGVATYQLGLSSGALTFNNTSERMRLDTSGNLGIGTTSPQARLQVLDLLKISNAAQSQGALALGDGSTTVFGVGLARWNGSTNAAGAGGMGYFAQGPSNSGGHYFYTGDAVVGSTTLRATIDTAGNLGLGVTPSAWGSNWKGIDLGGFSALANSNANGYTMLGNNSYASADNTWNYKFSASASMYRQTGGIHQWFNAASGTAGNPITFTQAMTLDASGNLLVGTTSSTLGSSGSIFGGSAGSYESSISVAASGNVPLRLYNQGTSGTQYFMEFRTASAAVGSITYNQTVTLFNTTSDYRLKTVTGALTGHGERIDALQPVEYTWNADGSRTRGFLAHQFQEVYAGSVSGTKDAVDAEGKPVYQAMQASSSEVIADLIAEIQDLRKRLAAAGI